MCRSKMFWFAVLFFFVNATNICDGRGGGRGGGSRGGVGSHGGYSGGGKFSQ